MEKLLKLFIQCLFLIIFMDVFFVTLINKVSKLLFFIKHFNDCSDTCVSHTFLQLTENKQTNKQTNLHTNKKEDVKHTL